MTLLKKFNQAPFELKAFAVFATLISILSHILPILLKKEIWEKTIQYTGWSPATGYMFGLYFVFSLIFREKKIKYVRFGIIAPLFITIIYGIQQQLLATDRSNTTNPYLMISDYQYIWTALIPAFWILVILFSPNINNYCKNIYQFDK